MTASFREGSGLIGKWVANKNTLESYVFQNTNLLKYQLTPLF